MWLNKLFKKSVQIRVKESEEKAEDEKGLNEEMVSVSRELEPKESDGLAKIFESTDKEEPEDAEGIKEEAGKEENK